MNCKKHPSYQGKNAPKTDCPTCYKMWQKELSAETTIIKKHKLKGLEYELKYYTQKAESEVKRRITDEQMINELKSVLSVQRPLKVIKRPKFENGHSEQELVLLFSDCQIGEKIQKSETGFKDYNIDVFSKRLNILYDSVVSITERHRKDHPIEVLNILMLGDIVEGKNIFRGQSPRLCTDVVDQMFEGQELISNFLRSLARHFRDIKVFCIPGNHGRASDRKDEELTHVNWDYVMYRNMAQILSAQKNITFDIDKKWYKHIIINNWGFYTEHGNDIPRYLRLPTYGLARADGDTTKMLKAMGLEYDYYVIGHFHTPLEWDAVMGERFINGTFSSGNPYAMQKLKTMARPTQKLFGVHKKQGISFRYNVRLDGYTR